MGWAARQAPTLLRVTIGGSALYHAGFRHSHGSHVVGQAGDSNFLKHVGQNRSSGKVTVLRVYSGLISRRAVEGP